MKKFIPGVIALVMLFAMNSIAVAETSVVATIFPVYDWVREVAGDDVDLTLLLDNGVDLHSYQPTAQDIMKVATCDMFVYVGGESDDWVEDALSEAVNSDMVVVNLVEAMGEDIKMEEIVEGMEHEHEEDHDYDEDEHDEEHEHEEDDDHDNDENHDHEDEADEHVWLSLRNAQKLVKVLASALGEADPANAERYAANADAYAEKLAALDAEYAAVCEGADYDTLLFGDRFPFRYLTDDYGLKYYAAFSGCSAESEASFETVVFLAGKLEELQLPAVMTIEGSDGRLADTVVQATGTRDAKILTLDSMQSTTGEDLKNGATYLSIMEENLEVLRQALAK